MKKLEKINFHKNDSRIQFNDSEHIYTIDDSRNAISVTQLIQKFFPVFDKEYWAEKESQKTGVRAKDIIEKWNKLGKKARELGTKLHNEIENYYNEIEYVNSKELQKFLEFHKKYIEGNYSPYRTEWRIFDQEKLLAGTIDIVYEKKNGELFIFDWKRSKKIINSDGTIEKDNLFENGLNGLSHLSSTDYNKYCLQQNIYKYILEKNYDKKVSSMNLLILHPNYDSYHIVKVNDLPLETDYLISTI